MQICLIIWIVVIVHRQYFIIFFISGSKLFSPSMKAIGRSCACSISLDHLDFRLYMFGSHSPNQDELGAYANSLDHLDWSHGVLAVFYNQIFISGSKFLSHQWRQLLELVLVLFFLIIGLHSPNQDESTVSFISRQNYIFLIFEGVLQVYSLCKFAWSFGL